MVKQENWQVEILQQGQRLESDLAPRLIGILLSCILFVFVLPFWLIFLILLAIVGTELVQIRLLRRFRERPARGLRNAIIANSMLGITLFCVPALLLWQHPEPLVQFLGLLSLIGALVNVTVMRSIHLPLGLLTSLPPGLALLSLPASQLIAWDLRYFALLALAGALVLLGYLYSALRQNNRMQRELIEAVRRTEAASADKTRLLRTMAHEIRTPLNTVLGHSQLLLGEDLPAAAKEHAAAIETASHHLRMLVEDVLDLASVSQQEITFRPLTAAIRQELEGFAAMRIPVPHGVQPEIELEIAREVPDFGRIDPILLRKCLANLAVVLLAELGPAARPRLALRCALAPGRQDRLRLTMSASDRAAADAAAAAPPPVEDDPGRNHGLPLSLVRSIAGVMGAEASLIRAPDLTVVGRIELPFVTVPEPPATGAESVYGRLRVLIVDDIPTNRVIVAQMLNALRIDCAEAGSGREALERLAQQDFDLVLLDMNMPDMDGEATLAAIRGADEPWAGIPVIAVTADTLASQRERYAGIGLNGYVAKPIDRRLLWAEILTAVPPPPPL
ncbi:response regulator [Albidovulum sp.]